MVKIYFDDNDGYVHFKVVDDPLFNTLNSLFRKYFLKFDKESKSWISVPNLDTYKLYEEIQDYTDLDISKEDADFLDFCIYPPSSEIKKYKFSVDKELIEKHPPLKGKVGKENFQKEAISSLLHQNRSIVDIQMRHGKTYIIAMTVGTLLKMGKVDKVFIVCRSEGVENFRLELLRFIPFLKEEDIEIIKTSNREIENFFDKKILITNYVTFRISTEYYKNQRKIKSKGPRKSIIDFSKFGNNRMIILDECQAINHYDSLQSIYLHLHKDFFDRRIIMSGSLGYNPLSFYSLSKFIVPDRIPYAYSEWRDYVSSFYGREIKDTKMKEFKERILNEIMISYRDCIEQKDNEIEEIFIEMTEKMRNIYQNFSTNFIKNFMEEKNNISILQKFGYLSQITSDPSLLDIPNWKFEDNPKLGVMESLLDKLIDEEKRKVIVWGNHPDSLNKLGEYFKKYNPIIIHGQIGKLENRGNEVKKFRENPENKILICNYVLATSITLTEATANIYWDLPLDTDSFVQSRERIRGITQKEITQTYYLLFEKSIDLYIYYEILQKKMKVKNLMSSKDLTLNDYKLIFNSSRNYFIE